MIIQEAIDRAMKDLGVSSDDTTIGNRYIYSVLKSIRSELLRQEIEKKGTWRNFPMQTLKRFVMEQIDIAESDEFSAGELILKSKEKFPELMDTKDGKILGGVFLPTGERFELSSHTGTINSTKRRYRSETAQVYIRDSHLYIRFYPATVSALYVDVDGLYESPEEVDRINAGSCENDCIYYPSLPFYLPGYLEGRFFRMVREDIIWSKRIMKDKVNNGSDDTVAAQPTQQQQP